MAVIGDVDALFKDRAAVNLLKCLCNTDATRTVYWGKSNNQLQGQGIPNSFQTTSRICILANTLNTVEANLAAVLDRAFVIHFRPTVQEVHTEAGHWCQDREVHDFVGDHLRLVVTPSMRTYVKAIELKRIGLDWRMWLLRQWTVSDPKLAMLAQITADNNLATAEQRIARFAELGGGSRPTFMRIQAKWRKLMATTSAA